MISEVTICFSIEIDKNINKLSDYFGAMINASERSNLQHLLEMQQTRDSRELNSLLGLKHSEKKRSLPFKIPDVDGRLFSHYFTDVVIQEKGERLIVPMRYRVRPQGSKEEVPAKYNVFNARIDALEDRQTWIPLFMKKHGLIPFVKFFEWVPGPEGKPKLISFRPKDREMMWAPCLYDEWISKDGTIHFKSFAIITDGPAPEIERMGHDRCPIFLEENQIENWLTPEGRTKKEIYEILGHREKVTYEHAWS